MSNNESENNVNRGKDVSMSQRQIYILSLLSENPRGYQAEDIRKRLLSWDIDVSRRTILRDIDELSLNYGILEDERDGKTYYYADKYTLKNVDLTIEDLASLAFAKEMLKEYSHIEMGVHAVSFIDRIVKNSAALNKLQFERLCKSFRQNNVNGNKDNVDWNIEHIIQNAIDSRNKLEIDYYSFSSDQTTKRIIHPYGMLMIDSYLCLEAFCELRNEIRTFRVARIKNIECLDAQFDEEIPKESEQAFLKLSGGEKEELELVFSGESIRYVKEYESYRANSLELKEDGLHFCSIAAIAPDVIRWVRGFGPEVKVVKPQWLAEQLMEEAESIISGKPV